MNEKIKVIQIHGLFEREIDCKYKKTKNKITILIPVWNKPDIKIKLANPSLLNK